MVVLFIVGAVGTAMLGNVHIGYLLLLSNFLSCMVMGLILPSRYKKNNSDSTKIYLYMATKFKHRGGF